MRKSIALFFLCLPCLPGTVHAADIQLGKELHQENCTDCHISMMGGDGSRIYTREDRRIDSRTGLENQVRRCKTSLGTDWPENQINAVVEFLDQRYYHFSRE
ncbi:MAG: cytochrome c [Gammaproteobacteria bacterium]|nr:cytochrome c [Gammaproteobacteria bacterium]MDH5652184.1 cytochrome c [Gammaproteobacteria bacterium]